MNESVSFLLNHKGKGGLVDTNLLLVYVVGLLHPGRLRQLHHTKQYEQDFPLVKFVVDSLGTIYTTPNVLTEVSNLGAKLKDSSEFFAKLKQVVVPLNERYCTSKDAVAIAVSKARAN